MIDFKICRACPYCEELESSCDEDVDDVVVLPSVTCGASQDVLLMNSDLPTECPYATEHKLSTQHVPAAFADKLSGCRSHHEAEI